MAWHKVSPEEAKAARYYGFGGWLLAFYLLLIVYLAIWIPQFFFDAPRSWDQQLYNSAILARTVFWVPFLILCPITHPLMPRITIIMMWLSMFTVWVIGYFGSSSHPLTWIPAMVIDVLFVSLMTWYFRSSRRVNVTYRHRVWT